MQDIALTALQLANLVNGTPFDKTYQGKTYRITPLLYAHAKAQIQSGAGEIVLFPEIVGNGMEQIRITL